MYLIPYTSPLWESSRGGLKSEEAVGKCGSFSCCHASGMEMKVFKELRKHDGVDREVAEFSLRLCLDAHRKVYSQLGGCDNTEIERVFSLMSF